MTLTHAELVKRWKKFVESEPDIYDDLTILKVYEEALEKVRKQGLEGQSITAQGKADRRRPGFSCPR